MPSTPELNISAALAERLHRQAEAARWNVSVDRFIRALRVSLAKAFAGRTPSGVDVEGYLTSLHLADLGLACACADGHHEAWDHFVRELRPALYRAAAAIAGAPGARDLADSLYAELFGVSEGPERRSLLLYFHGRSSLATWLRAVLAQRHVDGLRRRTRLEPLEEAHLGVAVEEVEDHDRPRWLAVMREALDTAVAGLSDRDRLRLIWYYAQDLTLAQIGTLSKEHEATVSRHLARTRRTIRQVVERELRQRHGLSDQAIAQCFASVLTDAGPLDLGELLGEAAGRKESAFERSK